MNSSCWASGSGNCNVRCVSAADIYKQGTFMPLSLFAAEVSGYKHSHFEASGKILCLIKFIDCLLMPRHRDDDFRSVDYPPNLMRLSREVFLSDIHATTQHPH